MLDLDLVERIPEYAFKQGGKTYTFDTIVLVSEFAKHLSGVSDPLGISNELSKILGLTISTQEAMMIMRDFESFANKFEDKLKALFNQSSQDPPKSNA